MMRTPPADFSRRLRAIDPGLIARWNPAISRWQILKLWSKGRNRDGSHAKGVKMAVLKFQGEVDGARMYRLCETGAIIGTLTGPGGEYRDLDDSVLCELRQADTWRRDRQPEQTFDQELKDLEDREAETHRKNMAEIDHATGSFIDWLHTDKIDLGAHNAF